jgi:hypothetical protein
VYAARGSDVRTTIVDGELLVDDFIIRTGRSSGGAMTARERPSRSRCPGRHYEAPEKERLKQRLAILLRSPSWRALAFFLPYLWGLYSGDDVPPEGIGRPLAAVTGWPKHSGIAT